MFAYHQSEMHISSQQLYQNNKGCIYNLHCSDIIVDIGQYNLHCSDIIVDIGQYNLHCSDIIVEIGQYTIISEQ
jgi:hypothetical protein